MTNILIAYFTWSGKSEHLAKLLQQQTGGTLFQIQTEQPYPKSYPMTVSRAYKELQQKLWPALAAHLERPERYERIYLVYPNWCGTIPMAVASFLKEYHWKGCSFFPLCTSGGSGMAHSVSEIAALCPHAEVKPGLLIPSAEVERAETEEALRVWLVAEEK